MPYIESYSRRMALLPSGNPTSTGELNYALTMVIKNYLNNKSLSYQTINDIIGALESSKLEFYRRIAVPYEEQKIVKNSDVY